MGSTKMNDFTPEQIEQLFRHSLVILDVISYTFLATGLLMIILYLIKSFKQDKFANKLNEHDKAVLFDYRNVKIFERKNKNDSSNSNNNNSNN